MNARRIAWSIVGLLSVSAAAWAGPMLIGATTDGVIYDVDPATGLGSNPRPTGLHFLSGIAFQTSNASLYGLTSSILGEQSLVRIDTQTGYATSIGPVDVGTLEVGVFGLASDPISRSLYALASPSGGAGQYLLPVDPANGKAGSPIAISDSPAFEALAFDPLGRLFLLDDLRDILAVVNPTTGSILDQVNLIPPIPYPSETPITFDLNGTLFLTAGGFGASTNLYTIDPNSGIRDPIGSTDISAPFSGLAAIPEPTTLFMILAGIVVLLRRPKYREGDNVVPNNEKATPSEWKIFLLVILLGAGVYGDDGGPAGEPLPPAGVQPGLAEFRGHHTHFSWFFFFRRASVDAGDALLVGDKC